MAFDEKGGGAPTPTPTSNLEVAPCPPNVVLDRDKVNLTFTTVRYPRKRVGKVARLVDGQVVVESDAQNGTGIFRTEYAQTFAELARIFDGYTQEEAAIGGVSTRGVQRGYLYPHESTKHFHHPDFSSQPELFHTRSPEDFISPPSTSVAALLVFDLDLGSAPEEIRRRLITPEAVYDYLVSLHPVLKGAGCVIRPSGSHGILNPDGTPFKDSRNWHATFGAIGDRVEAYERLHHYLIATGHGWIMISEAGSLLTRSPIDFALRVPNQLIFAAQPALFDGVKADRPKSFVHEGRFINIDDMPDGFGDEADKRVELMKSDPDLLLRQEQQKNRYVKNNARKRLHKNATRTTVKKVLREERKQRAERDKAQSGEGELGPDFVIHFHPSGSATVREILADCKRYHKAKAKDPIEPDYHGGAQSAILYTLNCKPIISCRGHGGATYRLVGDPDPKLAMSDFIAEVNQRLLVHREVSGKEGRELVSEEVRQWVADSTNSTLLRGTQGTGKTTAAARALAQVAPPGKKFLMLEPFTEKVLDAYREYVAAGGTRGMMRLGRDAVDLDGNSMCLEPARVAHYIAYHGGRPFRDAKDKLWSIQSKVCGVCPRQNDCPFQKQMQRFEDDPPDVVFAAHNFAYLPVAGVDENGVPNWRPDAVIIDEYLDPIEIVAKAEVELQLPGTNYQWQQLLKKYPPHADFSIDIKVAEKHRLKREIIEAKAAGNEDVYFYDGKYHLPRWQEYMYPQVPFLYMDGTAIEGLVELTLKKPERVAMIDVKRNAVLTQVVGNRMAGANMVDKKLVDYIRNIVASKPNAAFTGTKKLRQLLGTEDAPNWLHYGNLRGSNQLETYDELHSFGQMTPPPAVIMYLAKMICRRFGWELPEGDAKLVKRVKSTRDGSKTFELEYYEHPHPLVKMLMQVMRECEIAQALDRIRAALHEGVPKHIYFYGMLDLGIPMDRVMNWKDVKVGRECGRIETAWNETGWVPSSPKQATRFFPHIWNSEKEAKRDYAALPKNWRDGYTQVDVCIWPKPVRGSFVVNGFS